MSTVSKKKSRSTAKNGAKAAKTAEPTVEPPQAQNVRAKRPYPGLRYYAEDQEKYFAGREHEIKECADKLRKARVLILHGRTGCGKSSFLRAGVKPYLTRTGSSISFADAPDGFTVVRSTHDPLREFGTKLLSIVDWFASDADEGNTAALRATFGELRTGYDATRIRELFPSDEGFRERICSEAETAAEALGNLAKAMRTPPIIVIDQGEEVFTLKQSATQDRVKKKIDELGEDATEEIRTAAIKAVLDNAGLVAERRDREYFKFLHLAASRDLRTRIIVSLRTEYKGLFDDHIVANMDYDGMEQSARRIVGYHLKELDRDGLIAAILRPTLREKDPEWIRVKRELQLPADERAPGDEDGAVRISKEAAAELAKELLSDKVTVGGILPTLQAACIRLVEQSAEAREQRKNYAIDVADLRRIGPVPNQVEEYLQECVEAACRGSWSSDIPTIVRNWLYALHEVLVSVEADGRAVTKRTDWDTLREKLISRIGDKSTGKNEVKRALLRLARRQVGVLNYDDSGAVTLAHDSLALALNKWRLAAPAESGMMMARMGMGAMSELRNLPQSELFLPGDEPHETTIVAPWDFNWDRRLPHFAQNRGFTERLGVKFRSDAALDATDKSRRGKREWNWPALRAETVKLEKGWEDERRAKGIGRLRRWNEDNQRVLVAAEFSAFPGQANADQDPVSYAWRWSDLLVSNLFVGSALIGPNKKFAEDMADAMKAASVDGAAEERAYREGEADDAVVRRIQEVIKDALTSVLDAKGEVRGSNAASREFLELSAQLCGDKALAKRVKAELSLETLDNEAYADDDPLIQFMLAPDATKERFIVGQTATRAMASQCGFFTYFGARELAILAFKEMKRRQRFARAQQKRKAEVSETLDSAEKKQKADEIKAADRVEKGRREGAPPDLAAAVQKVVSHTVWNISLPASSWQQGLNRAFALRLAAIGYFTNEYARTNMDDFVGYIHQTVHTGAQTNSEDDEAVAGQRQLRSAIKEMIGECYLFLRFDEFGPAVFDLDSPYAYWSEHGRLQTRSVAGEIYQELVALRQRTLAHYQLCAESISWLRYDNDYDPTDANISKAFRLKELAWNNFNIYNFYDSERYMSKAADILRDCMERAFKNSPEHKTAPLPGQPSG